MAINDDVNFGADAALEKPVDADMVPLFEKPLTPSDVGKLNRLVIPKQHAEKHFPLLHNNHSRGGGGAASAAETVTLLTFEDDAGRCWRFRYSYWSSSQSYVLTKGWSRYVKENHLEAGDVVTFVRHRVDPWRLFIGCRRGAQVLVRCPTHPYPSHRGDGPSLPYQTSADSVTHAGPSDTNNQVQSGGTRRLRLFGVNLDCEQLDESPPSPADASAFLNHHFPAYSF